ncbi:3 beta-hydroxysteroid dehydrogenase/Delta 5--_4-isomerase-like [Cygnus olor]|uniref:3 beta-hydroxysteroid dehydrogenase/Delta 5-->4-isomerase-like n=1 Tax=Cygnus olor TaxID=8869 RepID=UPI001ADE7C43|nr:3 beta-hydroxysteroid dehydrogenase/Delta 5-->4-isomerase-like [Cygnus olor]XP_040428597.1 3 beta-hydroxysteroid dehydrogenase/Delta 5-->4-isomerase-like [Cygnus olor]XP_040428604.1 3 beta-hydroxysteroid dehydrogenase/Delta 5-->4-isomerase-like [Cygnus olor]XP_040428614.1 3 beta-hydroxysteroid dehydrogenase/Delta 5-->4-isomerase-like [Cygnus olor]
MSLAGVSCLVTGAGGFLGQRIIQLLLEEEEALAEIRLLDKAFSSEALRSFGKFQGKTEVKILEGDIRDVTFLYRACQGVSLVIHTASVIDFLGLVETQMLWEVNVTGTQMLLEASTRCNVQHFIYTSTVEVTGPNCKGDPVFNGDEDTVYECMSKSIYAQSKRLAEDFVLKADGQVLKDGGVLLTCALRSMYIFGEGCPFLQGHLDKCLLNKNVYLRFSRKEALVNPVYVGNIAWAHVQAAKALQVPQKARHIRGQFYYISDDTPHMSYADLNYELTKDLGFGIEPRLPMPLSVLYYFSLLLEIMSFLLRPFVRYVPSTNRHLVTLLNTPFTFSYRKAQKDFGYMPRYTWEEAKRCTGQWIASVVPQRREHLKIKAA